MNIAEAQLLDRSFDRLGDTLLRNRMLEEQKRERAANLGLQRDELASRMSLQRDELAARTADREDMRENRRLTLDNQREAAANLAKYREAMAAAKTEEDKMQLWGELLKSGSLDQTGLDAMAAEMSKKLGVQVKLAMPNGTAQKPEAWKHPETGEDFIYNPRSGAFGRSTRATAGRMTIKPGENGVPAKAIERDLTPEELAAEMAAMEKQDPPVDPLNSALRKGRSGPLQKELDSHLKAIEEGDEDYGFFNGKNRVERVKELQRQLGELDIPAPQFTNSVAAIPLAASQEPEPAPTDPKQRKANTVYKTPKGPLKWTGTGWVEP